MSEIKIEMSISVNGSKGVYTVCYPGGLPSALGHDEKAPVVQIIAKDVNEAIFKTYIQALSCILGASVDSSTEFGSQLQAYVRSLDLYPDNR
jgi:hypothetical protein